MVKSIGFSFRGPRFKSQHPHGSSQSSVTPVLGDMTPSHRHACRSNTNAHKKRLSGYRKNWRGKRGADLIKIYSLMKLSHNKQTVLELGMVTTLYTRYSEN